MANPNQSPSSKTNKKNPSRSPPSSPHPEDQNPTATAPTPPPAAGEGKSSSSAASKAANAPIAVVAEVGGGIEVGGGSSATTGANAPMSAVAVGGGSSTVSGAKAPMVEVGIGEGIEVGGGSSAGVAGRFPGEADRPPKKRKCHERVGPEGVPPICYECNRRFGSWKALFGHMRSHPDRDWRGVYPPPSFRSHAAGPGGKASSGAGGCHGGLEIDLNDQPHEEEISPAGNDREKDSGIDLNKPPAKDDSE